MRPVITLGVIMRKLFGLGTPRSLQAAGGAGLAALLLRLRLLRRLLRAWERIVLVVADASGLDAAEDRCRNLAAAQCSRRLENSFLQRAARGILGGFALAAILPPRIEGSEYNSLLGMVLTIHLRSARIAGIAHRCQNCLSEPRCTVLA